MNDLIRMILAPHPDRPLVIAHRGRAHAYPENTIASFDAAVEAHADMIELDIRTTADGQLVCVHDGVLDRYVGDRHLHLVGRSIASLTHGDIREVDVGTWKQARFSGARVPTLDEVLDRYPHAVLLIERKAGTPEQTLATLRRHAATDRVIVQSFDWDFVRAIGALEPALAVVALGEGPIAPRFDALHQVGAQAAHWDRRLTAAEIAVLQHAGLPVWVYTLNDEAEWRRAISMQIDGITTDRCDALLAALTR